MIKKEVLEAGRDLTGPAFKRFMLQHADEFFMTAVEGLAALEALDKKREEMDKLRQLLPPPEGYKVG